MKSGRARLATTLAIGAAVLGLPGTAPAKSVSQLLSFGGVAVPTSPYRYIAIAPNRFGANGEVARAGITTVLVAVHRDGGRLRRWWSTRGSYGVAATSYDISSGGGLSGDGSTLVLAGVPGNVFPPPFSRFAVLDTGFDPARGESRGRTRPTRYFTLRGDFGVYAISPDGSTLYLTQRLPRNRGPSYIEDHDLRALDLASGRLRSGAIGGAGATEHEPEGLPISRASSPNGDRAYTLYAGTALGSTDFRPFIERLDTRTGAVKRLRLPQLDAEESPFMLKLRAENGGRELVIASTDATSEPELRIDAMSFSVPPERDGAAFPPAALGAIVFAGLVAAAIVGTRRRRVRPG